MDTSILLIKPDALRRPWLRYQRRESIPDQAEPTEDHAPPQDAVETFVETLSSDKAQAILDRVKAEGFSITQQLHTVLSKHQASAVAQLFAAPNSASFHGNVQSLTAGPVIIAQLAKSSAVSALNKLVGKGDPELARAEAEVRHGGDLTKWPLIAAFGSTGFRNACLCAETETQARALQQLFFPSSNEWQRTVAIQVEADPASPEIETCEMSSNPAWRDALRDKGLVQCHEETITVSASLQAALGLNEASIDKQAKAFVVEGVNAVEALPLICRSAPFASSLSCPTSAAHASSVLSETFPRSLPHQSSALLLLGRFEVPAFNRLFAELARFGLRVQAQAAICPNDTLAERLFPLEEDKGRRQRFMAEKMCHVFGVSKPGARAALEQVVAEVEEAYEVRGRLICLSGRAVEAVFPQMTVAHEELEDVEDYLSMRRAVMPKEGDEEDPAAPSLQGVLTDALAALCKEKPAGLDAVEFLGKWLLENNPNKPLEQVALRSVGPGDQPEADGAEHSPASVVLPNNGAVIPMPAEVPPRLICVVGENGAEVCQLVGEARGFTVLSMPALLKREMDIGSELGHKVAKCLETQTRIETSCLIAILKKSIKRTKGKKLQLLVEGFPKDMEQSLAMEKEIFPCDTLVHLHKQTVELNASQHSDERLQPLLEFYSQRGKLQRFASNPSSSRTVRQLLPLLEPEIIVFRPGKENANSGTNEAVQAMERRFGYVNVCMAQLLVDEAKLGTKRGVEVKEMLSRAEVIADVLQVEVLKDFIRSSAATRFVLTDFPASLQQLSLLEERIATVRCGISLDPALVKETPEANATAALWDQLLVQGRVVRFPAVSAAQTSRDVARWLSQRVTLLCCWDEDMIARISHLAEARGVVLLREEKLLQAEMKLASTEGLLVESLLRSNQIVPADLRINILRKSMARQPNKRFLIQGFPKAVDHAQIWQTLMGPPKAVLFHQVAPATSSFESQILPMVDFYARQGIVKPFSEATVAVETAQSLPSIIYATPPQQNKDLLQKLAKEQSMTVIDIDAAFNAASLNPGPWFNQTIGRLDSVAEDSVQQAEEIAEAKAALVAHCMNTGSCRAVILQGDFNAHPGLIERLDLPLHVFHFVSSEESLKQAYVEKNPEAEEADIEQMVAVHVAKQAEQAVPFKALSLPVRTVSEESIEALRKYLGEKIVFVVGANRRIKSEVCHQMHRWHGSALIDFEKLLKDEVDVEGEHALAIEQAQRGERMVPLEVAIDLLQRAIQSMKADRFVIDGYPSNAHDGFPFIHDQVFALEQRFGKALGLVRLEGTIESSLETLNLKSTLNGPSAEQLEQEWKKEAARANACGELFAMLDKIRKVEVSGTLAEVVNASAAAVMELEKKEEAKKKMGTWTLGDGSPEALLHDVITSFNASAQDVSTAQSYFDQFDLLEDNKVGLQQIEAKLAEWQVENKTELSAFFGQTGEEAKEADDGSEIKIELTVSKDKWFQFVFEKILLLEAGVPRNEPEASEEQMTEEQAEA